jgi:hypothetical protein
MMCGTTSNTVNLLAAVSLYLSVKNIFSSLYSSLNKHLGPAAEKSNVFFGLDLCELFNLTL